MKIVIFSDIHGNLPAFEMMLKHAGKVDRYISLGDVVNYGPWSNECVQLLDSLDDCIKIMGNHEEDFLFGSYRGEKKLVKKFFHYCIKDFNSFSQIRSYIKNFQLDNYFLSHTKENKYVYPDSKISLDKNYIIGHSHYQFQLKSGEFVLFNAGSVGQNREFINVINYLILDTNKDNIYMKSISYDVDILIKKMEKMNYPRVCVDYYKNKKRLEV